MDATRTVLVIFAPPAVAFLLPLVAPLSGPGVPWLRFATTVWALLGTIIALDPDWSNRIAKMRQWINLMRSVTPTVNSGGDSSSAEQGRSRTTADRRGPAPDQPSPFENPNAQAPP